MTQGGARGASLSLEAVNRAMQLKLPSHVKLAAIVLANYADRGHIVSVSYSSLASICAFSRRQAVRIVSELSDLHLITKIGVLNSNCNVYKLNFCENHDEVVTWCHQQNNPDDDIPSAIGHLLDENDDLETILSEIASKNNVGGGDIQERRERRREERKKRKVSSKEKKERREEEREERKQGISEDMMYARANFVLLLLLAIVKQNISVSEENDQEVKCFGKILLKDGSVYLLTEKLLSELKRLYPAVDVEQELRKLEGWNIAHPKSRKTKRGILKHIHWWLANAKPRQKGGSGYTPICGAGLL
jgi:hypothetical protein